MDKFEKRRIYLEYLNEIHKENLEKEIHNVKNGKVILTFPDGFYWLDLQSKIYEENECSWKTEEGTTLYSLNDDKDSYVFIAIDEENHQITQCKDKEHKKPDKKYHKHIVELMLNKNFKANSFFLEFDDGTDFNVDDLNDELYIKLLSHNQKWLYITSDLKRFYRLFKNNKDVFKNLDDIKLLKIICENKDDENIHDIINILNGKTINYPNGILKFNSDYVIIEDNYCDVLLNDIDFELKLTNFSNFEGIQSYKKILRNFNNYKNIIEDIKSELIPVSNFTISKIKDIYNWQEKIKALYNYYIENIFTEKIEKEIEILIKFIKDETGVNIIKSNNRCVFEIPILNFVNYVFSIDEPQNLYNAVSNLFEKLKIIFSELVYNIKYDFITEINEYILNNINNEETDILYEKYGVSEAIEEWYDLIYYIITIQIEGFIDLVKKEPEKFKKILEIDNDEVEVLTAEISVKKEINKIITKYISKKNKMKLKDLTLNLSVTILPVEHFDNYLFPTDAYFDDSGSYFDGQYLNDCEIYIEIYLPDEVLSNENASLIKIMNDYNINLKIRQSLSHELDHAYEFFNRISTENDKIPDVELNKIRNTLSGSVISQISQDFLHFLNLLYLSLSFEVSARVTQLYFLLKEYKIDSESYFWSIVKSSMPWKELEQLKNFDPVDFYNNIKFELSDEDIKESLINNNIYTEEDFKKYDVKTLVVRYWLNIFNKLIENVNRDGKVKLKKISKQMFENPILFFKYYDKKFKKSWEDFYDRVIKMSVAHIKK